MFHFIKRFKENESIIKENQLLEVKINELEDIIDTNFKSRQIDFKEYKENFKKGIEQKATEIKESMQIIIDNKNKEIEKLSQIIEDNQNIVLAMKNQNLEIGELGNESVQRLKLAKDFFQKGIQQMERIFTDFATSQRRFKELRKEELPKLQENIEHQIKKDLALNGDNKEDLT